MSDRLYLLDTSVVFALVRGKELGQSIDAMFGLSRIQVRPLVSIVTHGEIWVLAHRNRWGEAKREALRSALENLVTVDIHPPAVIEAYVEADLRSQDHPEGSRNMGKNDLWIAACARAAGAHLLTNDQDFAHLFPDFVEGTVIPHVAGA